MVLYFTTTHVMLILVNKRIPLGDGNVAVKTTYFPEKDKKVINTIPGLEEQIFACRNKKRSDNPLLFIDRKDEERILMSRLQSQQKNEELASKLESLFHGNELSSPHSILCFIYWRYTKKIYRLSEDIISDVANTYVDNIPAQILKELLHGVSMFQPKICILYFLRPTRYMDFSFIHFWTIMEILSGFSLLMI